MATTEKRGRGRKSGASDPQLPGQAVLVLQGGGALGAYQVGVYRALHEAGIEPDWVIGTSIGAINGALIAGSPPGERQARLARFWERVGTQPALASAATLGLPGNALANTATLARGIPGFFAPNPALVWGLHARVGPERAAYYVTEQLRATLLDLVDFDRLNGDGPRFTVGAVAVRSAAMRYFDSRELPIGVEHVLASGALPPAFPAVRIDGELFWDGGVYSNTPIEAVFDDVPRRDSVVFAVQLWNPCGDEPDSLWQALTRHKEIQYASRAESHIARQEQLHRLRHMIRDLVARLPERQRADSRIREIAAHGCGTQMHVVRLIAPPLPHEDHTRDIDFTPEGIAARMELGYRDTRAVLETRPWRREIDPAAGVLVHDALQRAAGGQSP